MAQINTFRETLSIRAEEIALQTSATTILSAIPPISGFWEASGYAVSSTTISGVTLSLLWTDPTTGSAQTFSWLANSTVVPGANGQIGYPFMAQAGQPVSIVGQAGATGITVSVKLERA